MGGLRRLEAQAGLGLLQGALDAQGRAVEIDVAPGQRQQLATAQACCQIDGNDGVEVVAGQLVAARWRSPPAFRISTSCASTLGGLITEATLRERVSRLDGPLQRPVQDAMGVAHGAGRQRPALLRRRT